MPTGHGTAAASKIPQVKVCECFMKTSKMSEYILLGQLLNIFYFFRMCGPSMAFWGVRGVLEMIVSHTAPSRFDVRPYRDTWTHFRVNPVTFAQMIFTNACPSYDKSICVKGPTSQHTKAEVPRRFPLEAMY